MNVMTDVAFVFNPTHARWRLEDQSKQLPPFSLSQRRVCQPVIYNLLPLRSYVGPSVTTSSASKMTTQAPRESHFTLPLPQSDFLAHLEECISATESCSSTLQKGVERLEPGTKDLPRLTKILRNKHHYLLLPHPTIQSHTAALSTSLAPQIDALITKAENLVQGQSGRVDRLAERLSILQSARLPRSNPTPIVDTDKTVKSTGLGPERGDEQGTEGNQQSCKISHLEMKDLSVGQRRKVVMLRGKRERLEKEREKLLSGAGAGGGGGVLV
ncbi:Spc19-domain-containing protein [Naematelia encephala]|uniref:DASH complex subunit SPC19 n=1 Tax=Naematelia encephala TaxID=71784 RepID=A0A1Y2AHH2_9TREE|nr:Spc19-domain-containing protein [Naematelia encephala]